MLACMNQLRSHLETGGPLSCDGGSALAAQAMGIPTVAEFVSSESIFTKVKAMGINYSQGFYFGKPEPIPVNHTIESIGRETES